MCLYHQAQARGENYHRRKIFCADTQNRPNGDADLILVLEKGKLVEQGRHEELMQRQELYYYLSSQQLGG